MPLCERISQRNLESETSLFSSLPLRTFSKAFNFLLNVHVLAYRQLIKAHGAASEHFKWHMSDGKLLSYQRAFFDADTKLFWISSNFAILKILKMEIFKNDAR